MNSREAFDKLLGMALTRGRRPKPGALLECLSAQDREALRGLRGEHIYDWLVMAAGREGKA